MYKRQLYVGLAVTSRGPRVIEFNARFGDPDSQVVLARLRTGLGVLLRAAATGRLEEFGALHWSRSAAVNVVLAAQGYPSAPVVGNPIGGLDELVEEGAVTVLHAGTRRLPSGELVSSGGRVLNICLLYTSRCV